MVLAAGSRLGPYDILMPLGAGGMGEVYKARDTRLDRTVAIKILPDALAGDPQFRDRFDREARTISQLDHPHICALHDVGEHDGTSFLVMQYLEGETLEARLKKGALPLDQAVQYAIQIADALGKAHRAGIVHRDLKPGNIMLTKAGAKLLDFGLAKRSAPIVASAGLSILPTAPPNLTAQGTILGTFQYMAPEQLEGHEADARTDIFALGVVLYEMLTGKRAFAGKTQASLISSILKDEPPPISSTQPLTPAALDRVVKKCLAKDPDDRWQSARDLRDELKWIADETTRSTLTATAARARWRTYVPWALAAGGVIAAAVAVTVPSLRRDATDATRDPIRFSVAPPQGVNLTLSYGALVPAVSPDGRQVAFVASRGGVNQLWVRSLNGLDMQALAGTDGAILPFWSRDSRAIAFTAGGRTPDTIKTVDASGGSVQTVSGVDSFSIRGATWNRDGVIVFGNLVGGLFRVPATGGQPTRLTTPDSSRGETAHRFPSFMPDGRHFLYLAFPSNTIWVGSLDGKDTKRLINADSQAQYAPPGYLLFARKGTLMAQPFDARLATLTGDAVSIAQQLISDPTGTAAFSASDTGALVTRTGISSPPTRLTWVDRGGKAVGEVGQPGLYRNPALSPDGTRAAVEALDPQTLTMDIWLVELARGVPSRFTFDPHSDIYPVWSPDGARIAFGSDRQAGEFNLYTKLSNGAAGEELLLKSPVEAQAAPYSWSPDDTSIVYRNTSPGNFNLGILPLAGDRRPRLFQQVSFPETQAQVSPNGRWIAYGSSESGRYEVYVQSFPMAGAKWQISKDGGNYPRWRGDSRELFYYAADGQLVAVPVKGDAAIEIGIAVPLFSPRLLNGPNLGVGFRAQYDVTGDGQRFLLNVPVEDAPASPLTVLLNWTALLKK